MCQLVDHLRNKPFVLVLELLNLLFCAALHSLYFASFPHQPFNLCLVSVCHPFDILFLLADDLVSLIQLTVHAGLQLLKLEVHRINLQLKAFVPILEVGDLIGVLSQQRLHSYNSTLKDRSVSTGYFRALPIVLQGIR